MGAQLAKPAPLSASEPKVPGETCLVRFDPESQGRPPIPTGGVFYAQQTLPGEGPHTSAFRPVACFSAAAGSPRTPTLGQALASELMSIFMVLFTQRGLFMLGWGLSLYLGTEKWSGNSPNAAISQRSWATTDDDGDEEACHIHPMFLFIFMTILRGR